MKNSIVFFAIVSLLLSSCKKEADRVSLGLGESTFIKDGMDRDSKTRATIAAPTEEGLDFVFNYFDQYGTLTENLYIYKVPAKKGKFSIKLTSPLNNDGLTGASYFTLTDEGDVLEETYIVDEAVSENNKIEILSLNDQKKEVTGRFSIKMKIDSTIGKRNPISPDVISIEKGEFNLKIE